MAWLELRDGSGIITGVGSRLFLIRDFESVEEI